MARIADSKTLNSSRNLAFGIMLKGYQLLMPFIIRTIIIKVLGMEYAGLNSLFVSILSVLSIAELGVGSALVYSMYKPIEEKDTVKICALMKLYKTYYRIIGVVILVIGLFLIPFLPNLINGNIPDDINIYTLYLLNLSATVLSYWLFAYKNSLFQAHQRTDVISKVTIITDTVKYFLQIALLIIFRNYYFYVIVLMVIQVLNNILTALQADKYYPNYKATGDLEREEVDRINSSIKDVFFGQLGLVITLSVDTIVISAFLGLIPLAIYENYYYVINALIAFFTIFFQSCRASIGTNIIVKNVNENFVDFKYITFIAIGALTFSVSCLMNMYQPFIELWVGKENMLDYFCVILFSVYLLVYELSWIIGCYKDASGKWHSDRFRPLVTACVNLTMNIILVNIIGIYGILLSTIFAYMVINIPWLYKRVFIDVFDKSQKKEYSIYMLKMLLCCFGIVAVCTIICHAIKIDSIVLTLLVNLIVCGVFSLALYFGLNLKDPAVSRTRNMIIKTIRKMR